MNRRGRPNKRQQPTPPRGAAEPQGVSPAEEPFSPGEHSLDGAVLVVAGTLADPSLGNERSSWDGCFRHAPAAPFGHLDGRGPVGTL